MADELDKFAATKVASVLVWPSLDGQDGWSLRVDYPESVSPWEAKGILQAGIEHIDWVLEGQYDNGGTEDR